MTYVDNVTIEGTDNRLVSGLYYRFHNRTHKGIGCLSWTEAFSTHSGIQHYAQVVGNTINCSGERLHWQIVPSDSKGYYWIVSRTHPGIAKLSWTEAFSTHSGIQHYAQVVANTINCSGKRLEWRIVQSDNHGDFYQFENRTHPGIARLNWTKKRSTYSGNQHYAQVVASELNCASEALDWSIKPETYELNALIKDFRYGDKIFDLHSFAKDSVHKQDEWSQANMDPSKAYKATIEIEDTVQNVSSWSFRESHEKEFFNQLDVDVAAEYAGVKMNVHNTTKWSTKDTTLEDTKKEQIDTTKYIQKMEVNVEPMTEVIFEVHRSMVDVDIPFTAKVHVTGKANRIKVDGNTEFAQVDKDAVKAFLLEGGFKINSIKESKGKSVCAEIRGIVNVKGAVTSKVERKTIYLEGHDSLQEKGNIGVASAIQNEMEDFLGTSCFSDMKTELDKLGVEAVEDFKELDEEDIKELARKLKKVQQKRFLRKISEVTK